MPRTPTCRRRSGKAVDLRERKGLDNGHFSAAMRDIPATATPPARCSAPGTTTRSRRAGLTAGSLAHHRCDDSYGDLSAHTRAATLRFSSTDCRATTIDPAVFWRDVLEAFILLGNFGGTSRHEGERFGGAV
ncbi:hypothetical protein [Saccharothrix texasensis]|uniref:Uncharacterized protein n=1 Tax=Saccharothrix texasensis TaxID=103734 RepID=A0A3N1GXL2_9PSEU|nr:hypothetical protein [Saccharothrix texasensis]ROP35004.1 hypothetical protein EDD40_0217 [Saccharothrix texasensis]